MAVYSFHRVLVWDNLGGTVRVARNVRVDVLDPNTGVVPAGLTQGGQAVTYLTTDSAGLVEFEATVPTVELTAPNGLVQRITSQDALEAAAGYTVSEDAAVAGAIGAAGSASQAAVASRIDARLGGDASGLINTVAGKADQATLDQLRIVAYASASDFTSDTQARIDSMAANGGGVVEITKGATANLTASLRLKAGVRVRGRGKNGTDINLVGDFPAFVSDTPATRIDNWELSDLFIDRAHAAPTTPIIDLTGMSYGLVQDVNIRQLTARGSSSGIKLGAFSYYNTLVGNQVRGTSDGYLLVAEANRNRFTGNNSAITCNNGFVIDGTNSTTLVGASAEHIDGVGFLLRNGSKTNTLVGCGVEDAPTCYKADSTSITNFFVGGLAMERAGGVKYDMSTVANVLIDPAAASQLTPYTSRSYVEAYKSTAQASLTANTWTKVTFETEITDAINEFSGSTFTAATGGIYEVRAQVLWTAGAAGYRLELATYINGALARKIADIWTTNPSAHEMGGSRPLRLSAGDTVEIWARTSSALGLTSGANDTYLIVTRIA